MIPENWAEKPPLPPGWGKKFLTSDLSISGNFEQLWFLWQKSPPPGWGKIFWHQIYPFQAISSNFGFCVRKPPTPPPPPPQDEGKNFDIRSIHFRQFWATLVFVAEKPPPPRMREWFDIGSTTQRLPPVTEDYLPVTVTHLIWNVLLKGIHTRIYSCCNQVMQILINKS